MLNGHFKRDLYRRSAAVGIKDALQALGRDFNQFLRQLNARHVTQAEKSRVSDVVQLPSDRIVEFFDPVAMSIAPKGGNAVQISPAVNIDEIMAVGLIDDARVFGYPFLHLR